MDRGPVGLREWRAGLKVALIDKAQDLFTEIAPTHQLAIEWDNKGAVELACWLRKQHGLDWDLWLNLQNVDELGIQHEVFSAEWFPANDPRKDAEFAATLNGLIAGDVRFKCFSSHDDKKPFRVDLERISMNEWRPFFRDRRGFHIGLAASIRILRNGHPTEAYRK
jgi:hypothetical protein